MLTAREPVCLFRKQIRIDETWAGRYVALIAALPDNVKVPILQETAVVWVEASDGTRWYVTEASPVYPFHGWEWNTHHKGNAWTYRFAVEDSMVGRELSINLAWYGPVFSMAENREEFVSTQTPVLPEVQGYLVTVHTNKQIDPELKRG